MMASLPSKESSTSFWHSEPSEFLLNHRTTPDLPYADVVIIGSGITGASAARYLAEDERADGLSVVMLEAREACWGATGRVSHFSHFGELVCLAVKRMIRTHFPRSGASLWIEHLDYLTLCR